MKWNVIIKIAKWCRTPAPFYTSRASGHIDIYIIKYLYPLLEE